MGHLDDYRPLWAKALREGAEQVFGNAEQVEARVAERAELERYWNRPLTYVRDVLGGNTLPTTRVILRALKKHRRVHTSGCRKSTKSHTSGQGVNWFFDSGPCRIIITSATYMQVRENLFARIRQLRMRAKRQLPGRLGVTSLRMPDDPTWYAIGISTNKPGHIQGVHADIEIDPLLEYDDEWVDEESLLPPDPKLEEEDLRRSEKDAGEVIDEEVWKAKKDRARLLFVLDEMAEMRGDIIETMAGSWMGDDVYVLSQFNPTFEPDSGHPAAQFLKRGSGFYRIHIAGREPPPEMHPPDGEMFDRCVHGIPKVLMPDAWVEERLRVWGPNNARTSCHVYGLPASIDRERQVIPYRILKAAYDRPWRDTGNVHDRHMGWDVAASESGDYNVLSLRVCGKLTAQVKWHCADTLESADKVMEHAREWGVDGVPIPGCNIHVDKIGVGDGPVRYMRRKGVYVDAVDVGSAAVGDRTDLTGGELFVNRKTEMVWQARRELQEMQADIPREFTETIRQAQWYTLKDAPRKAGTALQLVETKKMLRDTHQQSPDEFDSYVLTCSRTSQTPEIIDVTDVSELWARFG